MDYRRVNARVLRNSYYSRKTSEVIAEAAGSAYLTLLDAVTGFNQIENTERAKQVLGLVSRSGQFLPIDFWPPEWSRRFRVCRRPGVCAWQTPEAETHEAMASVRR